MALNALFNVSLAKEMADSVKGITLASIGLEAEEKNHDR
jgi:hypothetical protein